MWTKLLRSDQIAKIIALKLTFVNLFQNMKAVMGRLMVSAVEEYDDIGMHLEPDLKKDPDPDKVIKGNPGFDPVFMKV